MSRSTLKPDKASSGFEQLNSYLIMPIGKVFVNGFRQLSQGVCSGQSYGTHFHTAAPPATKPLNHFVQQTEVAYRQQIIQLSIN